MEHQIYKSGFGKKRIGFHYYPDTFHYSEMDARQWPEKFEHFGIDWLVIQSPLNRAVPENFIRAFSERGIQLIVDFGMPNDFAKKIADLETLLRAYGRWGVRYALLNRMPNSRDSWPAKQWANPELVEKHAGRFLEFSEIALAYNIRPVFPPLMPGGDYWDLAFIQKSFQFLNDHASDLVKTNLALASFGWHFGKNLDWGAGGPKTWKSPKPYQAESEGQNQLGFRNYEWYTDIIEKIFNQIPPIILLESGIKCSPQNNRKEISRPDIEKQRQIYQLCQDENVLEKDGSGKLIRPFLPQVIANIFYILTSDSEELAAFNWFTEEGERLLSAQSVFLEMADPRETRNSRKQNSIVEAGENHKKAIPFVNKRYILLNDCYRERLHQFLELLHPYLEKYRPLIGFSIEEAAGSAYVVAIEPQGTMDSEKMSFFHKSGNILKTISPEEIHSIIEEVENVG